MSVTSEKMRERFQRQDRDQTACRADLLTRN